MQFDNIMDYTYMRAVLNKLTVILMPCDMEKDGSIV